MDFFLGVQLHFTINLKKLYFFIAIKPGLRICRRFQLPRRPRRGKLNTYRAANALCPTQMNGGATMKRLSTSFPVGDAPLDEYPRPQMVRAQWQNLNGLWQYAVTESPEQPAVWQGGIRVPFAPESALSGVEKPVLPGQTLWYFRTFSINGYDAAKRTLLHFGAVDYACTVFVNGREAGGHTGGYCPFTLDITSFVRAAENELTVAVTDDTDKGDAPRGKQVLHPKGIWYTAVTGIWQTVWLEQVDSAHFTSVHFIPSLDSVEVFVQASESGSVCMEVLEEDSCITAHTFTAGGSQTVSFEAPRLWTPEQPFLYRVRLSLLRAGRETDRVESYFGLRTFAVQPDENGTPYFLLNGRPYFQKGLLDQGYWPDGLYTAPSDEALRRDIEQAKALGFNMLRKHIKVEPARWYYHCDTMGMLVWQDMPSGAAYPGDLLAVALPNIGVQVSDKKHKRFKRENTAARLQFTKELKEMVEALTDAVCICTWVPFNEGWGQFDAAAATALLWTLDPTRPVDHASGWHDQGAGDYKSIHKYIFKVRPPHPDGRAFALTEYGGYSQVLDGHVWDKENSFGYRMYPDKAALTAAYRKLHEEQILPLLKKGLCVSIYTQLTDVELEVNGLFTYDRAVCKLDEAVVKEINQKLVL